MAATAAGCSTSDQSPAASDTDHTGVAQQNIVAVDGVAGLGPAFAAWPVGPIAFDGVVATMPIAIWSATPLGMLAFDIPGVTNLSLTMGAFDGTGAFIAAVPPIMPLPITTPFLTGITAGLTPFLASTTLAGATLLPAATLATPLLTPIAPVAPFLTPAITSSALMFTNMAATAALTPMIINIGFTWPAALNMAAINVFAASAAATTAFLGTSTAMMAATTTAAAASSLAFTNMLFPLTFMPAVGTLPATLVW
jgi:hypothetical protein